MEKPIVDRWIEKKIRKAQTNIVWEQAPSVTPGGKPYFYVTKTDKGNYWVVWDRPQGKWKATTDTAILNYFATAEEGKKYVENLLKGQTSAQLQYAQGLKDKIDKEASTFDQERWSDPNRRPGGIYRAANRKAQRERRNWVQDAQDDAKEFIKEYADTIKEQIIDKGEASTDLYNDYPDGDSYIHESYTDKEYDLQEAAEILDQLEEYEESDTGLWEGTPPRQAISIQAAFTYRNAVVHYIGEYIEEINGIISGVEGTEDPETGELVFTPQQIEGAIYEAIGEMPPVPREETPLVGPPKPEEGPIRPLEQFGQKKDKVVIKAIYDNEGKTADRYTILFDDATDKEKGYYVSLGVSDNPDSSNMGVSMWDTAVYPNPDLGKAIRFKELPAQVQRHVLRRLEINEEDLTEEHGITPHSITPLEHFGIKKGKKEGKMDLNKVIVDLWDRGVIGDRKVEALQRTPNRRLVQSELIRIAKTHGLGDILKVLADNQDGKVTTKDRHGYPDGDKGATDTAPTAEDRKERLPGTNEPAEKGVSPTGKEDRLPGVREPAKTPWDGWKRKYEEREKDIKDSKTPASATGTDQRLPGVSEGEHSPKGPYPGTHYGKKVDELNVCIKAQDFSGIAKVAKELEEIKRIAQHRTPFEISKEQRERDRKIEGAPHEPKISPSPQTNLGEPDSKIKEQAHGKTTDSLDTVGEVNPNPAVDKVKGTPDKLGNPESQIDLGKSLRSIFTGVEGETKEGQLEDFHLENKGDPKFEWSGIPGEQSQEPRTIKTTPELTEQKSTEVPGIGKGEDNQPPGKKALSVKCSACKHEMVLSETDEKVWLDLGKTICRCGNLIEAEVDTKIGADLFSGVPKVGDTEVQSLSNKKTAKKKAKKAQVNWVREATQRGESVLDRFFRMKKEAKKGQITVDENLPEVGAPPDRKTEDEAHDYDKDYKKNFLEETKPQKGEQKSDDHDYKGPVEDTLKDSPKPLVTQDDREKELKKGQIEDYGGGYDENFNFIPPAVGGAGTSGPNDGDCPFCRAIWDEDTLAEYGDMGEVDCPDCGKHVSSFDNESFDKQGQRKKDGPGRGSKTPERVKELAEDLKGEAKEPYGLATHIMEKERRKVPHRGPGDGRKLKYEEVKKLPREGQRVAIFDNGGKSEDRYFVVVGDRAYTINNRGIGTFIGDVSKFDLNHIVKATKRVATKDVPARVQRAIFRRVVGIRRGQLSETDPMQMTTGKPTSEIEKIKPTRTPQDTPLDVVMTPSIERSKGAGTPVDPTYLAEKITTGLRRNHYHTAQEGFNHIIRSTKDITSQQIDKLKGLMTELGYDVSEQKEGIVKTG